MASTRLILEMGGKEVEGVSAVSVIGRARHSEEVWIVVG